MSQQDGAGTVLRGKNLKSKTLKNFKHCATPLINLVLYASWHPPKNNTHGMGLMFLEVANSFIN